MKPRCSWFRAQFLRCRSQTRDPSRTLLCRRCARICSRTHLLVTFFFFAPSLKKKPSESNPTLLASAQSCMRRRACTATPKRRLERLFRRLLELGESSVVHSSLHCSAFMRTSSTAWPFVTMPSDMKQASTAASPLKARSIGRVSIS